MKKTVTLFVLALVAIAFTLQAQTGFKISKANSEVRYTMAIKPQFDNVALDFSEGIACVMIQRGQFHTYIDNTGKPISSETYLNVRQFHNGRAAVERDHKWGYINRKGKEIIPIQYGYADDFSDGLCLVKIDVFGDGHYYRRAYLDTMGIVFGTQITGSANPYSEGYAAVQSKDGTWMVLNRKFLSVSPKLPYDDIETFHEGLALVKIGDKYGFIDTLGNIKIAPKEYEGVGVRFSEGLCCVRKDGKWGFMDVKGNIVIPCIFTAVFDFSCGRAVVSQSGPGESGMIADYGVIDHEGNYVIEEKKYGFYGPYSEGLCMVASDEGKYGFIDVNGNVVVPLEYDKARPVHEGYAAVRVKGKWGFLKIVSEK